MLNKTKRPLAIWITQGLIAILFLRNLAGIMLILAVDTPKTGSLDVRLFQISYTAAFLLVLAIALWGLQKRREYGRWIALIALVGVLAQSFYGQHSRVIWRYLLHGEHLRLNDSDSESTGYIEYSYDQQLAVAATLEVFFIILLIVLITLLVFNKGVRRFFQEETPHCVKSA